MTILANGITVTFLLIGAESNKILSSYQYRIQYYDYDYAMKIIINM